MLDPTSNKYAVAVGAANHARIAGVTSAVEQPDAIVLAVPWAAVPDAIAGCGAVSGRLLIDVTNPLRRGADGLELAVGFSTSGGEEVARLAPGASVFKMMNQVGFSAMSITRGYPTRSLMFVAGDDAGRRPQARALATDLGFEAMDAGPLN